MEPWSLPKAELGCGSSVNISNRNPVRILLGPTRRAGSGLRGPVGQVQYSTQDNTPARTIFIDEFTDNGEVVYAKRCVYATFSTRCSIAAIFIVSAPHVLEETRSDVRPRVYFYLDYSIR